MLHDSEAKFVQAFSISSLRKYFFFEGNLLNVLRTSIVTGRNELDGGN